MTTDRRQAALEKLKTLRCKALLPSTLHRYRLSTDQVVMLSNMHPERASCIVRSLRQGISFSRANIQSAHVYDTCHWGEVASRMYRTRGLVLVSAVRLAIHGGLVVPKPSQAATIVQLTQSIRRATHDLLTKLDELGVLDGEQVPSERAEESANEPTALSFNKQVGKLRTALSYIQKNASHVLLIEQKTGIKLTVEQAARIRHEALRTDRGARIIQWMCQCKLLGKVRRPSDQGDQFGVGGRYAAWLDPLADLDAIGSLAD